MDTRYKTLSSKSAQVLKHFNGLNRRSFTIDEVYSTLKTSSKDAVKKLMRDMIKRGLLLRLKEGIYWIIPYEQDPETYFPNWHLIAQYLVGDAGHYIGYYSAMEIHNLITQPSLVERIVVNQQIKPSILTVHGIKFQFIYHNANHFFGSKNIWIDSFNRVSCSDLEKTFVDSLFKPDYSGGITEIAKALYKSKDKIDYQRLYQYCEKFKAQSVIKRLGFLLDLLEIRNPISTSLQKIKSNSFILLEPSYEKKGRWVNKWHILQNMEATDITSSIFT
ncbi:MAG TPA: type IV toxin-antitoxin system AbiEi family antitoxin [Puia sp.]|nr:type IV toxin-antitoxin system AbiEi family antitoxin [Puia sp.]